MKLPLLVLSLAVASSASGCFIEREYSQETIIEFDAYATFGDRTGELAEFRVVGRELQQEGRAPIGDRVRFRDVRPNSVITFDVEGYAADESLRYVATCDIGATPYSTVEADCRDHVRAAF